MHEKAGLYVLLCKVFQKLYFVKALARGGDNSSLLLSVVGIRRLELSD